MTPKSQALMDELISAAASFGGGATPARLKRLGEARLGLRTYVEGLEEELRWIPVSERLPEVGKVVHVIDMNDTGSHLCNLYETAVLVEVDGNKRFGFIGHPGWVTSDVTHWMYAMPLPEPPIVYGKACEE